MIQHRRSNWLSLWFLALLAACAGVEHGFVDALRDADALHARGEFEEARAGYSRALAEARELHYRQRGPQELRLVECLVELGDQEAALEECRRIHEEIEARELRLSALEAGELAVHEGRSLVLRARQAEPWDRRATLVGRREHEAALEASIRDYKRARRSFDDALSLVPEDSRWQYEARLGLGLTYLREGILTGCNAAPLRRARSDFRACEDLVEDIGDPRLSDDPRLAFYKGRVIQALYQDQPLGAAFDEYLRAHELEQQRGELLDEAYRDYLSMVLVYDTPLEVESLEDAFARQFTQQLIDWLRGYLEARIDGGVERSEWVDLRARISAHLERHQRWQMEFERTRHVLDSVQSQVRQPGPAVERYTDALARLTEIPDGFHDPRYQEVRTDVQSLLVEALLSQAQTFAQTAFVDSARESLRRAKELCTREHVIDWREKLEACDRLLAEVEAETRFLELQKQVYDDLQRGDSAAAEGRLGQAGESPDFVARGIREKISRLRSEVVDKRRSLVDVNRWFKEAETLRDPEQRLRHFERARELADRWGLESARPRARRGIALAHFDRGDHEACLRALEELPAHNELDTLIMGMCHYELGAYGRAEKLFRSVDSAVYLNSGAHGIQALRASGLTLLKLDLPRQAYPRFEAAAGAGTGAEQDSELVKAQLESCRRVLDKGPLDERDERNWRERLHQLDEDDYANLRRLIHVTYETAGTGTALDDYRRAYDYLLAYERAQGLDRWSAEELDRAGRLVACFADFVPLRTGMKWNYRLGDGSERQCRVLSGSDRRFTVRISAAGSSVDQEWVELEDERRLQKEFKNEGTPFEIIPVGLTDPQQSPYPACEAGEWGGRATIIAIGHRETVEAGEFENCIIVRIEDPRKSGHLDYYLAPGVGVIRHVNTRTDLRYELVQFSGLDE